MPRYEIAIANATAKSTWGNDLPRIPLWGTMGQVIPLLESYALPTNIVQGKKRLKWGKQGNEQARATND